MMTAPRWALPPAPETKAAARRAEHTYPIVVDGERIPGRFRFDIGRFLDRSKYNGDGTRK